MDIAAAQKDMRSGYAAGAPGLLASAVVWLTAGIVALSVSAKASAVAIFVGGMFIHPLGLLVARLMGRRGAHDAGNPLGRLALESTVLMLLCFPLAYVIAVFRIEWFFPALMLIIGGRYLIFATLYGMRTYWLCGACLAVMSFVSVALQLSPAIAAFGGAAVEALFAAIVFRAASSVESQQRMTASA